MYYWLSYFYHRVLIGRSQYVARMLARKHMLRRR